MADPVTADMLERTFPAIKWREPVPVSVDGETWYACRLCIGTRGLQGWRVRECGYAFTTDAACARHIVEAHS